LLNTEEQSARIHKATAFEPQVAVEKSKRKEKVNKSSPNIKKVDTA
jgi:hypothetical protein